MDVGPLYSKRLEDFVSRNCETAEDEDFFMGPAFSWNYLQRFVEDINGLIFCVYNKNIPIEELWTRFKAMSNLSQTNKMFFLKAVLYEQRHLPEDFYSVFCEAVGETPFPYNPLEMSYMCCAFGLAMDWNKYIFSDCVFRNRLLTAQFLLETKYIDAYPYEYRHSLQVEIITSLNQNRGPSLIEKEAIIRYLGLWDSPASMAFEGIPWDEVEKRFERHLSSGVSVKELLEALFERDDPEGIEHLLHKFPQFVTWFKDFVFTTSGLCYNGPLKDRISWNLVRPCLDDIFSRGHGRSLVPMPLVPLTFIMERVTSDELANSSMGKFSALQVLRFRKDLTIDAIDKLISLELPEGRSRAIAMLMANHQLHWTIIEKYYPYFEGSQFMCDEDLKDVWQDFSTNPNLPIEFFERHPETIKAEKLVLNEFTYQLRLDNNLLETTVARTASKFYPTNSLVHIVLSIVNEETQKLEREGKLLETF